MLRVIPHLVPRVLVEESGEPEVGVGRVRAAGEHPPRVVRSLGRAELYLPVNRVVYRQHRQRTVPVLQHTKRLYNKRAVATTMRDNFRFLLLGGSLAVVRSYALGCEPLVTGYLAMGLTIRSSHKQELSSVYQFIDVLYSLCIYEALRH